MSYGHRSIWKLVFIFINAAETAKMCYTAYLKSKRCDLRFGAFGIRYIDELNTHQVSLMIPVIFLRIVVVYFILLCAAFLSARVDTACHGW